MTSVMALDGVTSYLHWKDVTNTCKCMQNSQTIGRGFSVQWQRVWKKLKTSNVFSNRNRVAQVRELLSNNSLFGGQL